MDKRKDELMDRLAKVVVKGGGIGVEEAEQSSAHLHARVRAGIEAERRRRAERGSGWIATLLVASRAITALVLVTVVTVAMFWLTRPNSPVTVPTLSASSDDVSRIITGGTCALSATDECAISNDEVLATLFAGNGGKESK